MLAAVEELETALADNLSGREIEWSGNLTLALLTVEAELRKAQRSDGRRTLAAVRDLAQDILPTHERRGRDLGRERARLLDQVNDLLRELQETALFRWPDLPDSAGLDFPAIRRHGEQLVKELWSWQDAEARLLMETASTDIGAGD